MLSIGSFDEDTQSNEVCKDFSKMSSLSTESGLNLSFSIIEIIFHQFFMFC